MFTAFLFLLCAWMFQAQSPAQTHYLRGVDLLRHQDPTQAIAELDKAIKIQPQFAEAFDAKGLARLAQDDPRGALDEFRRALEQKPSLAEAHLGLGLALGQTGDLQAAAQEFRAAIRLRPNFAEAHKRLGVTLRRLGDDKGAFAEFEAAVKEDAGDPEAWYHLGLARRAHGDLPAAIQAFREAIRLKPDFEKAHYNLGMALRLSGNPQAGQKELTEISGLQQFRAKLAQSKLLILRGVEALDQGRPAEARRTFEQAAAETPSLPTAWHYLGVACDRLGDAAGASTAWRKALELQPDYPQTHNAVGLAFARAGDMPKAEAEFRQTVAADPDNAEAHYNLGLALARLGRLEDAVAEWKESVALKPDYTDARVQLGLALSAKGDPDSAAGVYRELIRQHPDMAEAHNNLGLVLLQMNQFADARREFHRALELRPGFAPALQNEPLTEVCQVTQPTASLSIPHVSGAPELNTDPQSEAWKRAASTTIVKDCTHRLEYPDLVTKVQLFWTDSDLYLLFTCPYRKLNLWEPPQNDRPRDKLWDRDVVEFFLGADWTEIRRYREFEIAPTGDWIDLAIDLTRKTYDKNWRSGWKTAARIDEKARIWYAAARVPLRSVSEAPVQAGTRWRVNLYRIDGEGPDSRRRFLCWQPTCVVNRDPNHVPENFGTLTFAR
jgi:tetratricopeptide (TPR) repeat protein